MTETIQKPETAEVLVTSTARWVRATRWAALTIMIWSVALQLMAAAFIPPVAAIGAVFGGLAVFLKGESRNLALVTAVLAVVALLGNLPGTIDELTHPDSAPAFILTLLVTIAAFVTMISGLSAFRGWSADPIKAVGITSAALFAAGVIVSLTVSSAVASAEPLDSDVIVAAQGVEFDQTQLVVSAGTSGFWVDNRDGIRHTFTIESLGLEIDVPAFSAQRADFDLDPGQYVVFCAVPGHENMKIDLTVEG